MIMTVWYKLTVKMCVTGEFLQGRKAVGSSYKYVLFEATWNA